jgi:hypothetical protein
MRLSSRCVAVVPLPRRCYKAVGFELCEDVCVPACAAGMVRGPSCSCTCETDAVAVWSLRYITIASEVLSSAASNGFAGNNGYVKLAIIITLLCSRIFAADTWGWRRFKCIQLMGLSLHPSLAGRALPLYAALSHQRAFNVVAGTQYLRQPLRWSAWDNCRWPVAVEQPRLRHSDIRSRRPLGCECHCTHKLEPSTTLRDGKGARCSCVLGQT